jgi:hypothetical protein
VPIGKPNLCHVLFATDRKDLVGVGEGYPYFFSVLARLLKFDERLISFTYEAGRGAQWAYPLRGKVSHHAQRASA